MANGDEGAYWYLGGYYCEEGRYAEGIAYLKIAATDGNEHQLDAEYALWDLYYAGKDVAQDYRKALAWYQKAKQHGANWLDDRIAACEEKGGLNESYMSVKYKNHKSLSM